jgi:hypothetical protein
MTLPFVGPLLKYVIGNAVDFDNAEAIIQEHEYVSLHSQKE